jgi:hypothetical protein
MLTLVPTVGPKFVPLTVTEVPIGPDAGLMLEIFGGGVTVKGKPLLATPLTVTTTLTVPNAIEGTTASMLVALQLLTVAVVLPNVTVLVDCVDPKFAPVIVTTAPIGPCVRPRVDRLGPGLVTVNATGLLCTPATVTTIFPVWAPLGTGTTIVVGFQLVGVAATPPKVTEFPALLPPKLVPVIVTDVPMFPDVGLTPAMLGVTVKLTPLLFTPATVTTTFPVVAAAGTGITMVVPFQLVAVPAGVPLKVTVLVPCEAPKSVPVIVTDVPAVPDVGFRPLMFGPSPPVPPAARKATICMIQAPEDTGAVAL